MKTYVLIYDPVTWAYWHAITVCLSDPHNHANNPSPDGVRLFAWALAEGAD